MKSNIQLASFAILAFICTVSAAGNEKLKIKDTLEETQVLELVRTAFTDSVEDLFRSYHYKGQAQEKPGLAKIYKEESDKRYGQAVKILRKFLQRGGKLNQTELLNLNTGRLFYGNYKRALGTLVSQSKRIFKKLNTVHYHLMTTPEPAPVSSTIPRTTPAPGAEAPMVEVHHNGELAHFMAEEMESESENVRHLTYLRDTVEKMATDNLAVHLFDSHLH